MHGALIQQLRKQIKPTRVVKVGTRVVDTNQIGSSQSHRAYANRLTSGLCEEDPLVVDRTPPHNIFPNGRPPHHGGGRARPLRAAQPEILELSGTEEIIVVKKHRGAGTGKQRAGDDAEGVLADLIDRTFDRTKLRAKSSPGSKKVFIKMVKNTDLVRAVTRSYVREKQNKGEPLMSQDCQEEVKCMLPETPRPLPRKQYCHVDSESSESI